MTQEKTEAAQEPEAQEISMSNTKKEMLAAYREVLKRLREKREAEMKPEHRVEEKQKEEAVEVADSLSMEGIGNEIGSLKSEIGKMLVELSDRMEEEIAKYVRTKTAVKAGEQELGEIYEIEKEASTLAALLEAQKEKREQLETEMAEEKEQLGSEIEAKRAAWVQEQNAHQAEVAARDAAEKKRRDREAEEYKYTFNREKQLAQEQFEYEKAKAERESQAHREEMERDLAVREKTLAEKEAELNQLREKAAAFPAELSAAVESAAKETTDRLTQDAQAKEALMKKEFEGQQNVLNSRIESLQQTVQEQQQQIAKLSSQLEKSYTQVQDIAIKAIEGSSSSKAFPRMQQQPGEQPRVSGQAEE